MKKPLDFYGVKPDKNLVQTSPLQQLKVPNSTAHVYYAQALNDGGIYQTDGKESETTLIYEERGKESVIILRGDFRSQVAERIDGERLPFDSLKAWFLSMEKEWGSSWSKNSSVENWKVERGIDL